MTETEHDHQLPVRRTIGRCGDGDAERPVLDDGLALLRELTDDGRVSVTALAGRSGCRARTPPAARSAAARRGHPPVHHRGRRGRRRAARLGHRPGRRRATALERGAGRDRGARLRRLRWTGRRGPRHRRAGPRPRHRGDPDTVLRELHSIPGVRSTRTLLMLDEIVHRTTVLPPTPNGLAVGTPSWMARGRVAPSWQGRARAVALDGGARVTEDTRGARAAGTGLRARGVRAAGGGDAPRSGWAADGLPHPRCPAASCAVEGCDRQARPAAGAMGTISDGAEAETSNRVALRDAGPCGVTAATVGGTRVGYCHTHYKRRKLDRRPPPA